MKLSQLRKLRTLAEAMRLASNAKDAEWCAREIARVIGKIDAETSAAPDRTLPSAAPSDDGTGAPTPALVSRETPARQPHPIFERPKTYSLRFGYR
jgi:hypothetical protein